MKIITAILIVIFQFNCFHNLQSQNTGSTSTNLQLSPVALMDIEPNNSSVILNVTPVTEAGTLNGVSMTNNVKWINFSSSIAPSSPNRTIGVSIVSGNLPAGIRIKIQVSPYTGSGSGALGSQVNELTLSSSFQTLIANIGAGFTGNGTNNGFMIRYILEISNFRLLDFNNSQTVSVSYLLSEI